MHQKSYRVALRLTCWAATMLLFGCKSSTDTSQLESAGDEGASVTIVAGSMPSEEQRTIMLAAKDALFQKLSGRLMEAMAQGPAQAIAVCKKEASQIAADVGAEHKLAIGRVGVRLRNPKNSGPDWAASLIESRSDKPVFAELSNGHSAALLPIKLQPQCVMCHGPKDGIALVIQEQLDKLYPKDQATGFEEGELRGWFWIDLPTARSETL